MAKLVDALDLGSSAARHEGSSPPIRTLDEKGIAVAMPFLSHDMNKACLSTQATYSVSQAPIVRFCSSKLTPIRVTRLPEARKGVS